MESYEAFQALSVCLVVASGCLIAPSLVGVGGSIALAIALGLVGAGLFVAGRRVAGPEGDRRSSLHALARVLWVGPVLGAVVVAVTGSTTAGELQTIGGVLGLAGMVNYFLVPVYALLLRALRYVGRALG